MEVIYVMQSNLLKHDFIFFSVNWSAYNLDIVELFW